MTTSTSSPKSSTAMSLAPRQWNNLVEALKNGSCVVLLGPAISTAEDGVPPLSHQFAENLIKELDKEKISYDKKYSDNLTYIMQRFTTIPNVAPSDPGYEAKKFYESHKGKFNSIQKTLAELPFNLIINTSPDDSIFHAFKQAGKFEAMYAYYNYRKEQKYEFAASTDKEAPLIFNLFGHYENAMSLVLTESDQVEFMKNVIRDQPPLPPKLIGQLDSHKTYLFLGFDWEQWNLRLLLEGLNLQREAQVLAHSRSDVPLRDMTRDFYQSSFQFSFITDNILTFVQELQQKFNAENKEETTTQKSVYIVSDPKDESFRDELAKNLKPLALDIKHEGTIDPGTDREEAIKEGINKADIILLMVSADFLASDDLYKTEWPLTLKRQQEGKCQVIPIITRACEWQQLAELTQMPIILPRKGLEIGKAISAWEDSDEAYSRIVKEIQELM
jgi:hypothetical protein